MRANEMENDITNLPIWQAVIIEDVEVDHDCRGRFVSIGGLTDQKTAWLRARDEANARLEAKTDTRIIGFTVKLSRDDIPARKRNHFDGTYCRFC
ncbi:MAG: hypothetical protein FWC38_03730 [Proteobacteria bacterium]|nr:hypothetical protein [Pseudomonadota bacterium]MCL2307338.1 hypothetical protein [Pseudomonadota bacterium]